MLTIVTLSRNCYNPAMEDRFTLVFISLTAILMPLYIGGRGISTGNGVMMIVAALALASCVGWLVDNPRTVADLMRWLFYKRRARL
ncbi:MAG: hypothetical protein CEO22_184 [Candidatus Berkelbacteria bacterium Gr01-1014_85]|uniref:Uncharacterized protein n=1 Tax=Candidatus Berkelbacteria bacterium Gr01-1014_85 TaxID=2017150 RepID=A0A554JD57_9BACT|nr:MAG: hypothetical protein CEO22_184 [Candidatus Berkelbacteria bacterium Gr01-1014_85]